MAEPAENRISGARIRAPEAGIGLTSGESNDLAIVLRDDRGAEAALAHEQRVNQPLGFSAAGPSASPAALSSAACPTRPPGTARSPGGTSLTSCEP